jgi:hypothetical protein
MQTAWFSNQGSQQVFDQVYTLLGRFSEKIQSIEDLVYQITSSWEGQESRNEWERFIRYF